MKKVLTFVVAFVVLLGFFDAVVNAAIEEDRNNAAKISMNAIHMADGDPAALFVVTCYQVDGSQTRYRQAGVSAGLIAQARSGECYVVLL